MQPVIDLNWLAIVASVAASFAIGGIWYGPLFGKTWARELGFPPDMKPSGAELGKGMALNIFGTLLMAYVLAHEVAVWRPSSWRVGVDESPAVYGFFAASGSRRCLPSRAPLS